MFEQQGSVVALFSLCEKVADLMCIIYSGFCLSKIIKIGWILTEIIESKVLDVLYAVKAFILISNKRM